MGFKELQVSARQEMKEIVVVVICSQKEYLLLHRVMKKKYDPGKWEFVSGFLQPDMDSQDFAEKQVIQETGLLSRFVKKGEPFHVHDKYGLWLIHPFLFSTSSKLVTVQFADHNEYRWIKLTDLRNFDCVKDLQRNLEELGILLPKE